MHFHHSDHRHEEKGGCCDDCMIFFERAHQDSLECCTPFNKHGTSGLMAMLSASHARGRQFDPGLVYIYVSRASVRHCATCRRHDTDGCSMRENRHQRSGAVVSVLGSYPKGPWIETTLRYFLKSMLQFVIAKRRTCCFGASGRKVLHRSRPKCPAAAVSMGGDSAVGSA